MAKSNSPKNYGNDSISSLKGPTGYASARR